MRTSDFKQLTVWQKGMDIVVSVYRLINMLPREEQFGLCDQMRRCSRSIPSNIAEGQSRNSNKEFIHFLSISRGSVAELQTQLILCQRLGYSSDNIVTALCEELSGIDKMLASLMRRLESC